MTAMSWWVKSRSRVGCTARSTLLLLVLLLVGHPAFAGPPFLTDDPEPVPFRHYEAYAFSTFDHAGGTTLFQLPAFEFNVGAATNLQLHVVMPLAYLHPGGSYGPGDVELGAKYRFVQETAKRPQVGVFPMVELPTGNSNRGLGNGQLWAKLPLWVQKSMGPWTTYGGGGYEVNRAPGMKDSFFAGCLVQRSISKRLTLGVETFSQGPQQIGGRATSFINGGGYLSLSENLSLLFMWGHTVAGERHTVGYLGLYYTWGRD